MKYVHILILLLILPIVQSASLVVLLDEVIIQGDKENALLLIETDTKFNGFVSLDFENIDSPVNVITVDEDSFSGSGPFNFQYSWLVEGRNIGEYSVEADLEYINGTKIDSYKISGDVNSSAPRILSKSPSEFVTGPSTTLEVVTNEDANCEYDASNITVQNKSKDFTVTGGKIHKQVISGLSQTRYTYYVVCTDLNGYMMDEADAVSFIVDFPPSAEISLSDSSPVKQGTVEITVITSENLDEEPELEYSFNDDPGSKKIISLTGSGSLWEGYMIITGKDTNKAGTFHFEGKDRIGSIGNLITEGKIFLVDTSKPPIPVNIEAVTLSNGDVKLRWYYEGEPVEGFNVYRSTTSGVDYIDAYVSVDNGTQFIDSSVTDKVTYYYKVAAVDKAENIGDLSAEVFGTSVKAGSKIVEEEKPKTEEPKVLPPNLVLVVDDVINRVDQGLIDVRAIDKKFESSDEEKKEILSELDLNNVVKEAESTLVQLRKQLEDLKLEYMTKAELDGELSKIDRELKKVSQTTPKDVTLIEKTEFVQSFSKEDTRAVVSEVFSEFDKNEESSYVNKIKKIQNDVNIEVYAKVVNILYLDETSKDTTAIRKKVSYLSPEPIEEVLIVEIIPSIITENIDEIDFKTKDYDIIGDSMAKWGFLKLDFEGEYIEYSIEKKINPNDIREAKLVFLVAPPKLETQSQIVGNSILSLFQEDISNSERFYIVLGFIIVVLLAGYYFIFTKNIGNIKEKVGKVKKKDKSQYPHLIKIKESAEKPNNANFEILNNLIVEAKKHVDAENFDKASSLYPEIQLLYSGLSKGLQKELYNQCFELQRSINEGKEEVYERAF